jgi:hypothetical protein
MAGSSRYIPLEDEDVDYENCDEDNPLGIPKYCSKEEERRKNNKKTKKKTLPVPQHQIDLVLAYKRIPALHMLAVADSDPSLAALMEEAHESILARQEIIRQEVEATGRATYVAEVTDSEGEEATAHQTTLGVSQVTDTEEEEATATQATLGGSQVTDTKEEEATAPRGTRVGRRRFRQGVVKRAQGVKKLN